ncbi:hypothetical protein E2C01_092504 [Portunus trituberculatus]|uniref:Uncharacterized protein n=1 Tax=Portunus trituberculatus TaxID=210409 RepID=A0A5B7JRX3_PORTR|nr:hypothetical protein [Portunus trituberculatus]
MLVVSLFSIAERRNGGPIMLTFLDRPSEDDVDRRSSLATADNKTRHKLHNYSKERTRTNG